VVENRGFRHAQLVLRASLKQGVAEPLEDDPFDTPREALSEPLDYLFDLSTPGYGVEFTWRTVNFSWRGNSPEDPRYGPCSPGARWALGRFFLGFFATTGSSDGEESQCRGSLTATASLASGSHALTGVFPRPTA
jgi:hypothetical protein